MIKNTRGRPRSRASQEAILRAAAELLEDHGFEAMTIEGIAARAKVSKQTVYRWWSSKADVLVEALAAGYLPGTVPVPAHRAGLRADLQDWFDEMRETIAGGNTTLVQAVLATLASGTERAAAVRAWLVVPVRTGLTDRFRAHETLHPGSLPGTPEFLAELLAGSLLLRLMFAEPTSQEWAHDLLDFVVPQLPPSSPSTV